MSAVKRSLSRNLLELNLSVLFISTSGALGRYIDLPAPVTIGMRAALAAVALILFCRWRKISLQVYPKDLLVVSVGGALLGLHWITYFYALQLSNVAIGMLSLFSYPAITAILEPLINKTKILPFHLLLCGVALLGIYFLAPDFDLENSHFTAVGFGLISALCYALRNIILKPKIAHYNGSALMVYQLIAIAVLLAPVFFFMDTSNLLDFLPATVMLAVVTTSLGHTLFLTSLRHFSVITASIVSCTQPIYGILIGMLFLQEYPAWTTVIGGALILSTVLAEGIRLGRMEQKDS